MHARTCGALYEVFRHQRLVHCAPSQKGPTGLSGGPRPGRCQAGLNPARSIDGEADHTMPWREQLVRPPGDSSLYLARPAPALGEFGQDALGRTRELLAAQRLTLAQAAGEE
jgi:hypothetical protein